MAADEPNDGSADVVLVLNSGSSSVKFAVVEVRSGRRRLEGVGERLGTAGATLQIMDPVDGESHTDVSDHASVVAAVLDLLGRPGSPRPVGVGHRVVHGGARFTRSVLIDDDVIAAIDSFSPLAPLHNPAALQGIRAVAALDTGLDQVAVFDTAFHQTMPPRAYRYAVAQRWYAEYGVRRYGFHGTSHRYVGQRAAELLGRPAADLGLVIAHLGNGCSATAVQDGESVDTTMGLTPLEGLVMGTRSGDVDPAIFGFLHRVAGLDADAVTAALNSSSGLLGLSGTSNDMRTVQGAADSGDDAAALAIDVFVHRLAKTLAGLATNLRSLDAVVFTGGIGEHSWQIRARTVDRLQLLGLELDAAANRQNGSQTHGRISTTHGPAVLVVPTDEELLIARDTHTLITNATEGASA